MTAKRINQIHSRYNNTIQTAVDRFLLRLEPSFVQHPNNSLNGKTHANVKYNILWMDYTLAMHINRKIKERIEHHPNQYIFADYRYKTIKQ